VSKRRVLHVKVECWPLRNPFTITGFTWETADVLVVSLEQNGVTGRAEAAGVYYKNDRPSGMIAQVESIREVLEEGIDRNQVQRILPPGGARNAVDCALWDLEAKLSGRAVWELASLNKPHPLMTTFTCGADSPDKMVATAQSYEGARAIKLKLTGEPIDAERVLAVRRALPDVWLGIDANQGFTREALDRLLPTLTQAQIALIEQPFPVGQEAWLRGLQSPIPIALDESVQSLEDISRFADHCQVINIKLDKCGGLTEGLKMLRRARDLGLDTMVGNMLGTSLAMSPAFVMGQLCTVVDLDGPIFLSDDRTSRLEYREGFVSCPEEIWGYGTQLVST
jgi:L-alanine-DL-glutamate epimerase-like enolase superfamily enzyme